MRARVLLCLAALALIGAAPRVDWTRRTSVTPTGAFVMGNPAAKTRLVEYLSYTCSHCAHFAGEAALPLRRDFVARGRLSVEFRHAVRDRVDFIATLVARCGGPGRFFADSEAILAAQEDWMGKAIAFEQANAERLARLPRDQAIREEAAASGLFALARKRGLSAKRIDACLIDPAQQKIVGAMAEAAWNDARIPGTPSFTINGQRAGGASWASLRPALEAAN